REERRLWEGSSIARSAIEVRPRTDDLLGQYSTYLTLPCCSTTPTLNCEPVLGKQPFTTAWGPLMTSCKWVKCPSPFPPRAACEFVCLPQDQAVLLPDSVAAEAGACLGIPALTALHAILLDGGVAGKTVFVAGGAGAVGHYAVQMASQFGAARVISSVSTPEK